MCGIAGVLEFDEREPVAMDLLQRMIACLHHRGPDEHGVYRDPRLGMISARLSIVDIQGGQQPMTNEDQSLWIVFNGEIFNYPELRRRLEPLGHSFATRCDTEVILHLYEQYGPDFLNLLNGQFAFALWDVPGRRLMLARDRLGIRPLFFARPPGKLVFGSEIKAILTHPEVRPEIDPEALEQIFTYWSPLTPRTVFRGIHEVPPGHYLLAGDGEVKLTPYWELDFSPSHPQRSENECLEELDALLTDASLIRLMADVPVGAYLSGGMDSSLIAAFISRRSQSPLETFSIAFSDPQFDESPHQRRMADFLGTKHQEVFCTFEDIARAFPDVIWHTETPILRTAPAPMFLLSGLVHQHGYKVVLTGEGADEMLAGYDIFKEMRIRRFWARDVDSAIRPRLLDRLYADIPGLGNNDAFRHAFFAQGLQDTESPFYSHALRWANTARTRRFLAGANGSAPAEARKTHPAIKLPKAFEEWSDLAKAQYLEITTFLSPYLLSSQGDRMGMAHSVEGRFPFLDYRVVEFCNRLPADFKQRGLNEKWLLRRLARRYLPSEIAERTKRPYRAPILRAFFGPQTGAGYVDGLLSPDHLRRTEYFDPATVGGLVRKARSGSPLSEVDEMALVGILSTQLVDHLFVRGKGRPNPPVFDAPLKLVDRIATGVG